MGLPLIHVDAFTDAPFAGNPAAVCLLDRSRASDGWMQAVAAEMNLSETAFVWPETNGFGAPLVHADVEVDLCGHATLASRPRAVGGAAPAARRHGALPHPKRRADGRPAR